MAKHRGVFKLRSIPLLHGAVMLHVPRRDYPGVTSSTLLIIDGTVTTLPFLATPHGQLTP